MALTIGDGTKKITLETREGETIADAARRAGIFLPMPCGGRGRCGKCAVMTKGTFPTPTETESRLLGRVPSSGYVTRLACLCTASDGEIIIPQGGRKVSVAGMTADLPPYDGDEHDSFGVAADIGTTTVSALLFSFREGNIVSSSHEMNRQANFGADVLSRIDYSNNHGGDELTRTITSQLDGMIRGMIADAGINSCCVTRIVVTGNTTMLHFLTGLDPRGIGVAPFIPESMFGIEMPVSKILAGFENAILYIPPSISAYVGADITCGVLSTGMTDGASTRMLIDVGTNGEMALYAGGRLICCSTAAGPAFEGASISMGMPAVSGAISRVDSDAGDGRVVYTTIDEAPPAGICGSGMISAIDMMLNEGVLDGGGRLVESGHRFMRLVTRTGDETAFVLEDSGVSLTQRDIRNIQLAKASIAAGASVLMRASGIGPGDLESLCLSGGFGSAIDPAGAAGIGLIPAELINHTIASGNTALSGASQLLFSSSLRKKAEAIASTAEEIPLSSSAEFMEEYVEKMAFRE